MLYFIQLSKSIKVNQNNCIKFRIRKVECVFIRRIVFLIISHTKKLFSRTKKFEILINQLEFKIIKYLITDKYLFLFHT